MAESFLNRFAQKFGALTRPKRMGTPLVGIAAFGKHPAWDDHVPEIGLVEPALIEFKRWLYDGITRNVDNGQWDNLAKSGQLQPFGHTLLWTDEKDWIVARCWQSMDGKGRDRYPMVAAAYCPALPLSWVVREAVPCLKMLQEQCLKLHSAGEIAALLQRSEAALRAGIPPEGIPPDQKDDSQTLLYLSDRTEMNPDRQGFLRVLYHLEREAPGTRGSRGLAAKPVSPRPFSLRVPPCADSSTGAAELWAKLLLAHPDVPPPIFISAPDHAAWLDLMIGVPGASQLFAIRAPVEVVPLTTDVPYTLEPQYGFRISHFLDLVRARAKSEVPASLWP